METERTERAAALFHAALALSSAARSEFLRASCASDPELAREVKSLLEEHREDSAFLIPRSPLPLAALPVAGERLGPWRLLHELGAGGMGTVFEAERADGAFEKRVAIKVIHADLFGSPQVRGDLLRRFEAERQHLANLDHPFIAKLLDGGRAPDGSPFLVMELVEGLPISRYCLDHALDLRARVRLFQQVCGAVAFVHSRLVAHRDLKPSNILVERGPDGAPVPKLLDFGIAKLLDPEHDLTGASTTSAGLERLTPAYASPEQFRREPITAATDVYSLGVVLYELISARLPYDLHGAAPHRVAQLVCEADPPRPTAAGEKVDRDLETIVLKALEKDPRRRYASAAELAVDLERFLTGHPILARPSTASYRLRKAIARSPLAFAIAAVSVLALCGLGAALVRAYSRSVDAEASSREHAAQAEARRKEAERTVELLASIYEAPDPLVAQGKSVTLASVLGAAAQRVRETMAELPLEQARLYGVLGRTFLNLGEHAQAQPLLESAHEIRARLLGPNHRDTILSDHDLAALELSRGEFAAAEKRLLGALEHHRAGGFPEDVDLAQLLTTLAHARTELGQLSAARLNYQEALRIRGELVGLEDHESLNTRFHLAMLDQEERRLGEAETGMREVLAIRERTRPADDVYLLENRKALAMVLWIKGQLAEAEALLRPVVEKEIERLGLRHPLTIGSRNALGRLLRDADKLEESANMMEAVLIDAREELGPAHVQTQSALANLATLRRSQGRFSESIELYGEALEALDENVGRAHPNTLLTRLNMTSCMWEAGETERALQEVSAAERLARAELPEGFWLTGALCGNRGRYLLHFERFEEAEQALLEAREISTAAEGLAGYNALEATRNLIRLYEATARPERANEFRAALEAAAGADQH